MVTLTHQALVVTSIYCMSLKLVMTLTHLSYVGGDVDVFALVQYSVDHSDVTPLCRRVDATGTHLVGHVKGHTWTHTQTLNIRWDYCGFTMT